MSVRMKEKERKLTSNLFRITAVSGNSVLKEHGFLGVSHGNLLFTFVFKEGQMEKVSLDQFFNVVLLILKRGKWFRSEIKKRRRKN